MRILFLLFFWALPFLGQAQQTADPFKTQNSWFFGLYPTTNINRGTTNTELETALGSFRVSPQSQAQSGVTAALGNSGFLSQALSKNSRLSFLWTVTGRFFEESDYNAAAARLGFRYDRAAARYKWSIEPFVSRIEDQFGIIETTRGWSGTLDYALTRQDVFTLKTTREDRSLPRASYLDGPVLDLSLGWSRKLPEDRAFRLELIGSSGRPEALHQQFDAASLAFNYAWTQGEALDLNVGLSAGARKFVGVAPLQNFAREDTFWEIGFKVRNRNFEIFGDAPTFGCDYVDNQSNLDLYVFDAFDCSFGVSF